MASMEPRAPPDPTAPSEALAVRDDFPRLRRARRWSLVMVRGVLAIVFAVLAFVWPLPTMASLVLLFSAYMLVDGIIAIASGVRAARARERWGWFALEGIADIAAAVVAFFWPAITILAFVLLVAVWALVSGALMLVAAFRHGTREALPWLILAGAMSLAWGVLLVIAPVAGAIAMTWWLGAYALAFGVVMVAAALRLRRESRPPLDTADELSRAV